MAAFRMDMESSTGTPGEQSEWLAAAIAAAQCGGRVLQEWLGRFSVREKSRSNLVTDADEASQGAIVEVLRSRFPGYGLLGEENLREGDDWQKPCWVIDPLDGTTNYVHGFPYYCVSVALAIGGQVEAGAIFDPTRGDVFAALRGKGATLNGVPMQTSGETRLGSAMGIASLPVATSPDDPAVRRFLRALGRMQTVQRTGSAALNLASLAAGRIDAFWSTSLHPWDVAAGVLLVQEAGGSLTTVSGGRFDLFVPDLLAASTAELGRQLADLLP
jgi:myo-inositol-1(or 4)-monophosphatase